MGSQQFKRPRMVFFLRLMMCFCVGEYWLRDLVQLEQSVIASGGAPPPADAFTINGHPGPNYNCSNNGNNYDKYLFLNEKILLWIRYMNRDMNFLLRYLDVLYEPREI